ncbi:MAG TPA: ABC transporter substrate-binding protein [Xanthobacteraceae bacterium]|nr:ABC transporter substrate-binding protein [Xanthobacteraceae bacterium]
MSKSNPDRASARTGAHSDLSRRATLGVLGAVALAPLGGFGAAYALTGTGAGTSPADTGEFPICRTAATETASSGPPRALKLAWNASAICTSAAPVAKERGYFAARNLEVEFINFGGSTEQLLEAIATGKADAGIGMALRWLKPLEQGFDVKITAGIHGGCMRLLAGKDSGIARLEDLRGKTIAISDQASPSKNFFSIALTKRGVDPVKDVEWRQYPMDLLALAIEKGEAQALADGDPRTWLWLKNGKLTEVATNLSDEYATRTCCVLAIRGSLIRDDRAAATALTRALLEAGDHVAHKPEDAAAVFSGYGGQGSVDELAAMLRSHTHHDHPVAGELKKQIALYADELKLVKVIKPSTDTAKFAERVYADVLSEAAKG